MSMDKTNASQSDSFKNKTMDNLKTGNNENMNRMRNKLSVRGNYFFSYSQQEKLFRRHGNCFYN
jgi:hypothetical protein